MTDPGTARAWGWAAHLRGGGTTPWHAWGGDAEPAAGSLPGAQQLELLRCLNDLARPDPHLVERVLATDPPRRARPSLPLAGGPVAPPYGPRPVDPATVTAEELVELVAVLLADDLAGRRPPAPPSGRHRPWAVRYHLHGDPELARVVRRHLAGHGRPPATHGGRAIVLGTDVGQMLLDLWTSRALGSGAVAWPKWWRRRAADDRLPGPTDLVRAVEAALATPGLRGLHLVTDPTVAPRLVGLRRPLPASEPLAAAAVDLGRRVSRALRPVVDPETRRGLVSEVLRPRLATVPGAPLAVPPEHRAWVEDQATALLARLQPYADRYPVHGHLDALLPEERTGAAVIRPRDTLAAGIRLLLADTDRPPTPEASSGAGRWSAEEEP